jgi:hypothetical protein
MEKQNWIPNPVAKRLQLAIHLGQICREPARYYSEEFEDCLSEIAVINTEIRRRGIDQRLVRAALDSLIQESYTSAGHHAGQEARSTAEIIVLPMPVASIDPSILAA